MCQIPTSVSDTCTVEGLLPFDFRPSPLLRQYLGHLSSYDTTLLLSYRARVILCCCSTRPCGLEAGRRFCGDLDLSDGGQRVQGFRYLYWSKQGFEEWKTAEEPGFESGECKGHL